MQKKSSKVLVVFKKNIKPAESAQKITLLAENYCKIDNLGENTKRFVFF